MGCNFVSAFFRDEAAALRNRERKAERKLLNCSGSGNEVRSALGWQPSRLSRMTCLAGLSQFQHHVLVESCSFPHPQRNVNPVFSNAKNFASPHSRLLG